LERVSRASSSAKALVVAAVDANGLSVGIDDACVRRDAARQGSARIDAVRAEIVVQDASFTRSTREANESAGRGALVNLALVAALRSSWGRNADSSVGALVVSARVRNWASLNEGSRDCVSEGAQVRESSVAGVEFVAETTNGGAGTPSAAFVDAIVLVASALETVGAVSAVVCGVRIRLRSTS
jgi:hypothetical protein